MSGLRMTGAAHTTLERALLEGAATERCAIGYAHHDSASATWVLETAESLPDDSYDRRDRVAATLKSHVLIEVANHARASGMSPIFFHTHPDAVGAPHFSAIDDRGEAEIRDYLERRAPAAAPLAVVMGPQGARARRLGYGEPVDLWTVGADVRLLGNDHGAASDEARNDRQIRALGREGQQLISRLKILVVGAGGTGSASLQQLAYLGASDVTVIDPDRVEESNLNRLIGAAPADIGLPKVAVARRMVEGINPTARVEAIVGDIVDQEFAERIGGFDFVFLCTDSHASRAIVCQAAYQFLVPVVDMGVSITVADGAVTHITGRVQMLAPGLPCLTCTGALDSEQVRREMLTPEQRAADPYVVGGRVPQPAVVSVNSSMASLAVTMFLGAVTAVPVRARYQRYDGLQGVVRLMAARSRTGCIACSGDGALAKGGNWPLPARPKGRRHG
ncbi:Molybdopterin or thiamine biosynthesis adenylyltransferase [Mesorhizobium albiziae]|uniref:Molybdopterin or thiamine biosynthesis adenylyltransferase n=1 Tax=Neomesorhizobium albiziae TaxID=335020 RepID=A0A1I4FAL3_9HYPH|nr:ThiF family adenylyltransferase [Mesorhizobium albiziae]GLS33070.1 hypothetical protein GCM10007937_47810 [Mesorhizobium albiziae]SFL14579.1 Molybdopterin or thiamine biosynthesis adenylyltransferase [Mesorhizobium albiziae]